MITGMTSFPVVGREQSTYNTMLGSDRTAERLHRRSILYCSVHDGKSRHKYYVVNARVLTVDSNSR